MLHIHRQWLWLAFERWWSNGYLLWQMMTPECLPLSPKLSLKLTTTMQEETIWWRGNSKPTKFTRHSVRKEIRNCFYFRTGGRHFSQTDVNTSFSTETGLLKIKNRHTSRARQRLSLYSLQSVARSHFSIIASPNCTERRNRRRESLAKRATSLFETPASVLSERERLREGLHDSIFVKYVEKARSDVLPSEKSPFSRRARAVSKSRSEKTKRRRTNESQEEQKARVSRRGIPS